MSNLWQDLRYAVRMLRKSPGFTTVAIITLALGIGANTAVFTVVNGVLLRPMPFPEPDRLFLVSSASQHGPFTAGFSLSDHEYLAFREQDRLFERLASFNVAGTNLTGAGDPIEIPAASVTADFFATLRIGPKLGHGFLAGENKSGPDNIVMLSDQLWTGRFGSDPHILGKTIELGGVSRTVIGIMPAGFVFPNKAAVWIPLDIINDPHDHFSRSVIGRLKQGVSREQALAELETFTIRWTRTDTRNRTAQIVPLKESLVENVRRSLLVFLGAVGFVLLIACANVANLFLARAASRKHEMAVRSTLGAARWRLLRQVLTESTIISLLGGTAGVLLAFWGVPALIALAPVGTIPRLEMVHVDGAALAFTLGISVFVGILFGLVPALRATGSDVRDSLNQSARTTSGHHEGVRRTLVISEIAFALVLLTGAGLMLKSFLRLRAVNPGFQPENILTVTVDLPDSTYQTAVRMHAFHAQVLEDLSRLPGVLAVGAVNWRPLGETLSSGYFMPEWHEPVQSDYMVDKPSISPGYFRTMGIQLLRGRDFSDHDNETAPGVAVVSQSVAMSFWPGKDPLGKRISLEDHPKPADWLTIIGVVDDVKQRGLSEKSGSAIYQTYLQTTQSRSLTHMTFVVRTASTLQSVAPEMRSVLRKVDKDLPIQSIATMDSLIAETTAEPRFQAGLLALFAAMALALAVIGVYGVLAYAVTQRTREIGIRMALGAQRADVLRVLLRDALILACAGTGIGIVGALTVTRVLATFLFEVRPNDPLTFALVALTLMCAALAAGTIPARRAMKTDPMVALRYE